MKTHFYVVDSKRKWIAGRFFQRSSAEGVRDLICAHSADPWVRIYDSNSDLLELYIDDYKRVTEADLQALAAEKYLTKPEDANHPFYKGAIFVGGVYDVGAREQLIAVRVESNGPKYVTWHMVGALTNRSYRYKHTHTIRSGT